MKVLFQVPSHLCFSFFFFMLERMALSLTFCRTAYSLTACEDDFIYCPDYYQIAEINGVECIGLK